ncbi:hypothetical protein EV702DRAFT_1044154 [Suillus placidus]|uniref:Uncharacterized protein n=1 Tax=Suillus placidus TaxID=48579 RepID=A0A9P7A0J3_9AGAM|nr:hypothetical protein EV702DRAFT_1044154 [Suillus placidus]
MTLYSQAQFTIGRSLLNLNLEFIRRSRWGTVKLLYLACRYLPFVLLATDTYQVLQPALPLSQCEPYVKMNSWLQGITFAAAECVFILRTYAIWGRSRMILIILMCSCAANFIPVVYIITVYNNSITIFEPPIPNITSCYNVSESRIIVAAFVLLVVFEFAE